MRALLLGAAGMLARDLIKEAPPGTELVAPAEREADITDEAALVRAVTDARPEVILNCAAYTNVDRAEAERERAFVINGEAPGIIGRAVRRCRSRAFVVHYSTDYVFDGQGRRSYREDDVTGPLGAYGQSKLAGERALAASGAEHLIIRTQWLFGLRGRSFPRTMWERARSGQATRVVNDQVGRPTYTVDLARATWNLVANRGPGTGRTVALLHVANSGRATWYDVARRVFAAAGAPQLLSACATREYPTPAARPAFSPLDTSRYESLAGETMPAWETAVDRFLNELRAEAAP